MYQLPSSALQHHPTSFNFLFQTSNSSKLKRTQAAPTPWMSPEPRTELRCNVEKRVIPAQLHTSWVGGACEAPRCKFQRRGSRWVPVGLQICNVRSNVIFKVTRNATSSVVLLWSKLAQVLPCFQTDFLPICWKKSKEIV